MNELNRYLLKPDTDNEQSRTVNKRPSDMKCKGTHYCDCSGCKLDRATASPWD